MAKNKIENSFVFIRSLILVTNEIIKIYGTKIGVQKAKGYEIHLNLLENNIRIYYFTIKSAILFGTTQCLFFLITKSTKLFATFRLSKSEGNIK